MKNPWLGRKIIPNYDFVEGLRFTLYLFFSILTLIFFPFPPKNKFFQAIETRLLLFLF